MTATDASAIDAVVTWVDGDDPAHASKRLHFQQIEEPGRDRKGGRATRFQQVNELEWCLRLLRKHAPWLRTIHLVTDAQRPAFLTDTLANELGVRLVDHTALFAAHPDWLPTFNSLSIETLLWNVPGLAEHFLYFNDDVFLVNPATPGDFFTGTAARMRGAWTVVPSTPAKLVRELRRIGSRHLVSSTFRDGFNARWAERDLLPETRDRYFALAHAPFPVITDFMREVVGGALESNAKFRFRSKSQFNPMNLLAHRGLARGLVVPGPDDWQYLSLTDHSERVVAHRLHRCGTDPSVLSLCVQGLERATPSVAKRVTGFLERTVAR